MNEAGGIKISAQTVRELRPGRHRRPVPAACTASGFFVIMSGSICHTFLR